MKPIYWRLLSGDYSESTDFSDVLYPVSLWMYAYDELGKLVGEHNIMDLLNSAYCRSGGLYNFFHLLRCIMDQSYRPYIKQWPENAIDKEIEKLEVSGDSERGEMLCVLSAYLMIEHTDLSEKHKDFSGGTAGAKLGLLDKCVFFYGKKNRWVSFQGLRADYQQCGCCPVFSSLCAHIP